MSARAPLSELERERQRWRNLLAAVASITVFGFALGEMFPLLALIMERAELSDGVIGINNAMQPVGILLAGFTVPPLVTRYGAKRVLICAACIVAAIVLAYPATPIFWAWFGLRIVQGAAVSTLFSISEAWIVQSADGEARARIIALYTSVLAASFGLGPALIAVTGIEGILPFAIGAVVLLAAMLPVLSFNELSDPEESSEGQVGSFFAFLGRAPVLLLSVGVFAIFDAACLGFLPVYALRKGLDQQTAALTLTILVLGNVALQFPVGWLGDKFRKRLVMAGCVLITGLGAALLPVTVGTPAMWVVLIVIGTTSSGIYTMALSEIGERFTGSDLVTGTSAMATMWGAGALIGALVTGWAMQTFGPDGFPYLEAAVQLTFFLVIIWRERDKSRHSGSGRA